MSTAPQAVASPRSRRALIPPARVYVRALVVLTIVIGSGMLMAEETSPEVAPATPTETAAPQIVTAPSIPTETTDPQTKNAASTPADKTPAAEATAPQAKEAEGGPAAQPKGDSTRKPSGGAAAAQTRQMTPYRFEQKAIDGLTLDCCRRELTTPDAKPCRIIDRQFLKSDDGYAPYAELNIHAAKRTDETNEIASCLPGEIKDGDNSCDSEQAQLLLREDDSTGWRCLVKWERSAFNPPAQQVVIRFPEGDRELIVEVRWEQPQTQEEAMQAVSTFFTASECPLHDSGQTAPPETAETHTALKSTPPSKTVLDMMTKNEHAQTTRCAVALSGEPEFAATSETRWTGKIPPASFDANYTPETTIPSTTQAIKIDDTKLKTCIDEEIARLINAKSEYFNNIIRKPAISVANYPTTYLIEIKTVNQSAKMDYDNLIEEIKKSGLSAIARCVSGTIVVPKGATPARIEVKPPKFERVNYDVRISFTQLSDLTITLPSRTQAAQVTIDACQQKNLCEKKKEDKIILQWASKRFAGKKGTVRLIRVNDFNKWYNTAKEKNEVPEGMALCGMIGATYYAICARNQPTGSQPKCTPQ